MKHFRPRLSRRAFWVLCALLVCLRLALTGFQQAYIWVGGAPLDDELMFRAANHITAGQWLGAYDYLTLSKAMFFPVWLALLHALHLPYLISGAALWCGAALLAALAFSTLWRKKDPAQGRVLTLSLFAALAFLPSSWAAYTLRVYRDNIFPALCLYFFAGMAGMALRAVFTPEKPLWPWLAAAGAGLACGYLDREDAGLFLLPFAAAATVIVAVVLAGQAPLEGSGRAGHPVCHARRRRADLLHPQLRTLRRVCAVRLFGRLLCRGHGRNDARGHRQHRALPLRARRRPRENLRRCAGIGAAGLLAGGGRPAAE